MTPSQGTLRRLTESAIRAGTFTVAWPAAGSTVADPSYTVWMIREGPAGSVAVHAPLEVVMTVETCVNWPSPFAGAVRISTGASATGTPCVVTSRPWIVNALPYGTSFVVTGCRPSERQTVVS